MSNSHENAAMGAGLSDTDPRIERAQIELLRKASSATRFARARSLSQTAISLARRALRRRHPNLTEREIALLWVEHAYGEALASRLREYLERRER